MHRSLLTHYCQVSAPSDMNFIEFRLEPTFASETIPAHTSLASDRRIPDDNHQLSPRRKSS